MASLRGGYFFCQRFVGARVVGAVMMKDGGNGIRANGLVQSRRARCHISIATQLLPKQANRYRHARMTRAARPMRPSMDSTPRPKCYGARLKIRLRVRVRARLRKHRYLTGLI